MSGPNIDGRKSIHVAKSPLHDRLQAAAFEFLTEERISAYLLPKDGAITIDRWFKEMESLVRGPFGHGFVDISLDVQFTSKKKVREPCPGRSDTYETHERLVFFFEIKPEIGSLGQLLRQMRVYEESKLVYLGKVMHPKPKCVVMLPQSCNEETKKLITRSGFMVWCPFREEELR